MTTTQTKTGWRRPTATPRKNQSVNRLGFRPSLVANGRRPGGFRLIAADIDIRGSGRVRAVPLVVLADAASTGTEDEQVSIVLGVGSTLHVNRVGRVGGADGQIGEHLVLWRGENAAVPLVELIDIAVFTFDPNIAGPVDGRSVDAPLETIRVLAVINTEDPSIGL